MSLLSDRFRRFMGRLTDSWVLFAALGLVIGLLIAPFAFQAATTTTGTVAVVPVAGGVNGAMAAGVSAQLQKARADPSIEAVVLVSNSPGGGAAAGETMYLEVARTAEQMPVVASVDSMAASAAYYTIAPSDYIYAKPSSFVGSVGVFISAQTDPQPIDRVIASGPNKLSGGTERDWSYKLEAVRSSFVGAVYKHRGDNLTLSREEVSKGTLFTGGQAVQNGMADEVGGTSQAVRRAARMAGLDDYQVTVLRPTNESVFVSRSNYVASSAPQKRMVPASHFVGQLGDPAVPNIVMMPPSVVAAAAAEQADRPETPSPGTATPNATNRTGGAP
jgi:protease-4